MLETDKKDSPPREADAGNWEAVALSRVARRVEELPQSPDDAEDFGWEEGVLAKLRKRLADNQ
jgi:hypothetical protein